MLSNYKEHATHNFLVTSLITISIFTGVLFCILSIYKFTFNLIPATFEIYKIRSDTESYIREISTFNQSPTNRTILLKELENNLTSLNNNTNKIISTGEWTGYLSLQTNWIPIVSYELFQWQRFMEQLHEDIAVALRSSEKIFEFAYDTNALLQKEKLNSFESLVAGTIDYAHLANISRTQSFTFTTLSEKDLPVSIVIKLSGANKIRSHAFRSQAEWYRTTSELSGLLNKYILLYKELEVLEQYLRDDPSYNTRFEILLNIKNNLVEIENLALGSKIHIQNLRSTPIMGSRTSEILNALESISDLTTDLSRLSKVVINALWTRPIDSNFDYKSQNKSVLFDEFDISLIAHKLDNEISNLLLIQDQLKKVRFNINSALSQYNSREISSLAKTIDSEFHKTENILTNLINFIPLAETALPLNEPKTYLVLGQSTDEMRATGGFVFGAWIFNWNDGNLINIDYFDIVDIDNRSSLQKYPRAPVGLEKHMNAWVMLMRDVSWEPDFPSSAKTAIQLMDIGKGIDIDGVIAVNQTTFLEITKSLYENEIPQKDSLESIPNILTTIEEKTDSFGRKYTDEVLRDIVKEIRNINTINRAQSLIKSINNLAQSKDLLIYMKESESQQIIKNVGMDGGIVTVPHDYIYIVDSNVGWSKSDRNMERAVEYSVNLTNYNQPYSKLLLYYKNHSGPSSAPCEPQWRSRGNTYDQQTNACYWNFLRIYLPHNAEIETHTNLVLPEQSMAAKHNFQVAGSDTVSITNEVTHKVLSGLLFVEATEHKSFELNYKPSVAAEKLDDSCFRYSLYVQKQPGVNDRKLSLTIEVPKNSRTIYQSHPFENSGNILKLEMDLNRDEIFEILFTDLSEKDRLPHTKCTKP